VEVSTVDELFAFILEEPAGFGFLLMEFMTSDDAVAISDWTPVYLCHESKRFLLFTSEALGENECRYISVQQLNDSIQEEIDVLGRRAAFLENLYEHYFAENTAIGQYGYWRVLTHTFETYPESFHKEFLLAGIK